MDIAAVKSVFRRVLPYAVYTWLSAFKLWCHVFFTRYDHFRHVRSIRAKVRRGEPIRVLFVDSEVAKWKAQSLYDLMLKDDCYDPIIGVSRRDSDVGKSAADIENGMRLACDFYEKHGDHCVEIYDSTLKEPIDLRGFKPDIVFFQQPWYYEELHDIRVVCKFALPCYIPYFTPGYGFVDIEGHQTFHRLLGCFFLLNDAWVREYSNDMGRFYYSGKLLGVGQPMFDYMKQKVALESLDAPKSIIYAPHFSISKESDNYRPLLRLSTFLENGREILRYAKEHRECKWIFKPHPVLKTALEKTQAWTEEEVCNYYKEWGEIGEVCESSDYMPLFSRASVMITDCASFLPEFGATGKPLIHLISSRNSYVPAVPSKELFSAFYEVRNLEEMFRCFKLVLEENQDPLYNIRMKAVTKANLAGTYAAKNIMDFFAKEFGIKG